MTPQGFPLAYEFMDGNTSDTITLKAFLAKTENECGCHAHIGDRR